MFAPKLISSLLSVGVAGAVIGGVTFALTSSDVETSGWNTYFVVATTAIKPDEDAKTTCKNGVDCVLNKLSGNFFNSDDAKNNSKLTKIDNFANIKIKHQYVLQTKDKALKDNDQIELNFGNNQKRLFKVKGQATLTSNKAIKAKLPAGIVEIKYLQKPSPGVQFAHLSKEQKDSRKYHFDLYPTFIERENIYHNNFLIFSWKPANGGSQFYTYWKYDGGSVDKYLFKTFEDQINDEVDNSRLNIDINSKGQASSAWLEVYEIKNQEQLSEAFKGPKSTNSKAPFKPDGINWEEIAKENEMVTKFTALEEGKYYKFVFHNFEELNKASKNPFTSLILRQVYTNGLTQKILEFDTTSGDAAPHACKYIKGDSANSFCNVLFD